ncbi:hypothetical protein AB0D74_43140 [Streptomyces sp. NPDC048278]|uniref:hypothetical protein n=1 Tax=Streptomyces sp. NPDC048278 TaxID=3155809 RepID=UPI0034436FDB
MARRADSSGRLLAALDKRIGQQETGSAAAQPTTGTDEAGHVPLHENEEATG